MHGRRDFAHDLVARTHRPAGHVELELRAVDLYAGALALHALGLEPSQRFLADEGLRFLDIHQPVESDFEWIRLERHVDAVVENAGFDAPHVRWPRRRDVVALAGFHHALPDVVSA